MTFVLLVVYFCCISEPLRCILLKEVCLELNKNKENFMSVKKLGTISGFTVLALGILLVFVSYGAETLNPEGINPHADAPRKKITQKQKQAAADAMKKKKAEIKARNAEKPGRKASDPMQIVPPVSSDNSNDNVAK
jgi:hypothetical protein